MIDQGLVKEMPKHYSIRKYHIHGEHEKAINDVIDILNKAQYYHVLLNKEENDIIKCMNHLYTQSPGRFSLMCIERGDSSIIIETIVYLLKTELNLQDKLKTINNFYPSFLLYHCIANSIDIPKNELTDEEKEEYLKVCIGILFNKYKKACINFNNFLLLKKSIKKNQG